jgi:hypothetical protein
VLTDQLMTRSFPPELITCIGEGRRPSGHDLTTLCDKLSREVRSKGRLQRDDIARMARPALAGSTEPLG